MSIIIFLLILIVLIFVHELGHFIVAKKVGMKVEEFSLGFFNPVLYQKKIGETVYSIRPFLLGGYVKIYGEGDGAENKDPRAFNNRPWIAKMLTLVAGVTMNIILAYFIFVVLAYGNTTVASDDLRFLGRMKNDRLLISYVIEKSPAALSGIRSGATINALSIGGVSISLDQKAEEVIKKIALSENKDIRITYTNVGEKKTVTTLALVYGIIKEYPNKKALGITLEKVSDVHISFFESFILAGNNLYSYTIMTFSELISTINKAGHGENVIAQLQGPIGIATMVGEAKRIGYESVLMLMAFLSLNLAVLNILPFPALDGGQMVRVSIEALLRRRLSDKYVIWLNGFSFLFLVGLMLVVSVHDIIKLF